MVFFLGSYGAAMKINVPQRFSVRTLAIVVTIFCLYLAAWEATKRYGMRTIVRQTNPQIADANWFENEFSRMTDQGFVSSPMPFVISLEVWNANGATAERDYFVWFFGKTQNEPFYGASLRQRPVELRSPFPSSNQPIVFAGPTVIQPEGTRVHKIYGVSLEIVPESFNDRDEQKQPPQYQIVFLHPNDLVEDGLYAKQIDGVTIDDFSQFQFIGATIVGQSPTKNRVYGRLKIYYDDPKLSQHASMFPQWVEVRENK